jgi:hypothetical protein
MAKMTESELIARISEIDKSATAATKRGQLKKQLQALMVEAVASGMTVDEVTKAVRKAGDVAAAQLKAGTATPTKPYKL